MNLVSDPRRQFAYNAWANAQTLRPLRDAAQAPERAVRVMAHIVGSEWHWLGRLGQPLDDPKFPVWPDLSLVECESHLRSLARTWTAFLDGLPADGLSREVAYTNSKGERWTNTVADILMHVILHSSYHRGQIAGFLGQAGQVAAYTDYIECIRRGHHESGSVL